MGVATGAKRGRPATASPDEVLRAVTKQYLDGERVALSLIARQLGLSRATIYRWFGSREALLGEAIARQLEQLAERQRREVRRRGARGLLEVFDRINRSLARSRALRRFLEQERSAALRLLTAGSGVVQPRAVAYVETMIEAEVVSGRYEPPTDIRTLAYAIVRLAEAFLYNDTAVGIRGEHARLRQVEAALLGVRTDYGRGSARRSERGRRPGSHSAI